jgi:dihydroneopterin aldolase
MKDQLIKQLASNFNLIEELTSEVVETLAKHYNRTIEEFIANIFISAPARKAFVNLYCETLNLLKAA